MPKCDGYYGAAAHLMQTDRRTRQRKLIKHPSLCERVMAHLKDGWAPEQIGNRMRQECAALRVCQETIYRYIYSKEGMRNELWWYLPLHRKNRTPRRARKPQKPKFDLDVSIIFRPDDVAHRRQFGHWEGDLMLFEQKLGQTNVTPLGTSLRDTLSGNAWQKGTVENTNRRARRWLPRKRDIRSMTDQDIKEISDRLNNTPRKCLGWKTPAEVFREKMLVEMR